jgi:hypothetical protein
VPVHISRDKAISLQNVEERTRLIAQNEILRDSTTTVGEERQKQEHGTTRKRVHEI